MENRNVASCPDHHNGAIVYQKILSYTNVCIKKLKKGKSWAQPRHTGLSAYNAEPSLAYLNRSFNMMVGISVRHQQGDDTVELVQGAVLDADVAAFAIKDDFHLETEALG